MPTENLAIDWNRELRSPAFRDHFHAATQAEPALSRFVDAAALVRFMRLPAERSEKDAVLCALLRWAKREPTGARVVLETIRPGLLNMAGRLLSDARDAEELWAILLAAIWEGIRDYPLPRRTHRVAANLLLDALRQALAVLGRESEWRSMWVGFDNKTPAPQPVESDIEELLDGAVLAGAISAGHLREQDRRRAARGPRALRGRLLQHDEAAPPACGATASHVPRLSACTARAAKTTFVSCSGHRRWVTRPGRLREANRVRRRR